MVSAANRVVKVAWLRCRKSPEDRVFGAEFRYPTTGKLCQPSSKWVPLSVLRRIRQRKERDGLRLALLCPRYNGSLTSSYGY